MPTLYHIPRRMRQASVDCEAAAGRISEIHHIAIRFMRASKSLNSDALQRRLHYHSAWLRTTQARSTSSRRGDFSWGAAPNPECKQVSCGFSSVRGVWRCPTLKIRALRNMLIGSAARSMRRSGNEAIFVKRRSLSQHIDKCQKVKNDAKLLYCGQSRHYCIIN